MICNIPTWWFDKTDKKSRKGFDEYTRIMQLHVNNSGSVIQNITDDMDILTLTNIVGVYLSEGLTVLFIHIVEFENTISIYLKERIEKNDKRCDNIGKKLNAQVFRMR